ncbi:p26 [Spodoptera frugiperda multiple nucleopolyhedrovirus]|uniref:p26 n=1 Tax=Spodoptera frugiperda nuclear polyhedrosis virus TaxID=10455 RepID=A1YJ76_NPVSF|nr:p26 [Spodoptera frugiperda multiple nucleopolyhedrovirus]ABM45796.1 p26 [Spodoptera frugiperda multiple nucleopolyhedrovirus]ADV91319.1 p26a [Spodoptera frugiperda multiple nucleopolyhedrovirus]AFH59031.1 p26a [Spodoptera frugiperda multiple nucleopolyhedrovirus]QED39999.1 P26A [Spodoptera frugiperda multiple nucleopolyhedrovirus]
MSLRINSVATENVAAAAGAANVSTIEYIKSITYCVNHMTRRVYVLSEKNCAVRIHVFGQHDTSADFENIKYHYPGVASDVKFLKLKRNSYVNILLFNANNKPYLRRMRIQDRMYYTHHHYAKYYVYGQVPAIMQKNNLAEFMSQLYVSAPIFDDNGTLISVVTDYYVNDENHCIVPIAGDAGGAQGTVCLDGFVYVTDPNDHLTFHTFQILPRIDVYVTFDKKNVYINVVYNGEPISKLRVKTQFAGNVLIL